MTKDLLLEIGVEEIPSGYMKRALDDFKNNCIKKLQESRLTYEEVNTWGTPRRLTLLIKNLAEMQEDKSLENRGPKKTAAFDDNGSPTKALQGFARAQALEIEKLEVKELNGIEYVFATKKEQGIESEVILPKILEDIVMSISFPKSMRWAYSQLRFARPIRWLLVLYGEKHLKINLEDLQSQSYTYGHRFLSKGKLEVKSIEEYFSILRNEYVILDQEERKQMIIAQMKTLATDINGIVVENEDLLEEINYLVEYPTAFCGNFSASYLQVPTEVLTTSMIAHQRYVPIFNQKNELLPAFIGVRNGNSDYIEQVKAGNERVLKARLEDALFFWKEDTKDTLANKVTELSNVLYHERLGSMMEKVERMQIIGEYIAKKTALSNSEQIKRAAYLCKADLLSHMVYEFTELQGIMGRYYARLSGEDNDVCEAIYEHYLPRFAGDILPQTECGTVLSMSEKLYNICGAFAIGMKPSGSQDPYALRRQALGITNIILQKHLEVELSELIEISYETLESIKPDHSLEEIITEVSDFILQRLRGVLFEKGISYDVLDAVFASPSSNLINIRLRCNIIQEFKNSEKYNDFMLVFNRTHNLSKKWNTSDVEVAYFVDESEKSLWNEIEYINIQVIKALEKHDYILALNTIAQLREKLDVFFETVMIMVEDKKIKANRLSILKNISSMCLMVADFSKLV